MGAVPASGRGWPQRARVRQWLSVRAWGLMDGVDRGRRLPRSPATQRVPSILIVIHCSHLRHARATQGCDRYRGPSGFPVRGMVQQKMMAAPSAFRFRARKWARGVRGFESRFAGASLFDCRSDPSDGSRTCRNTTDPASSDAGRPDIRQLKPLALEQS